MAYIDSRSRNDRIKSVAGVVAVHGALGYALLVGLQASGVIEEVPTLIGETITEVPVAPPPEPDPAPSADDPAPSTSPATAPAPTMDLSDTRPDIAVIDIELPPIALDNEIVPLPTPAPSPGLGAGQEPVAASPRNDPAGWVTQGDYRSSWINRELTGIARFRLDIGADGRVRSCTITGSSGHAELDRATCDLVTRRARFEPARGVDGSRAPGSYSSAVSWQIPN